MRLWFATLLKPDVLRDNPALRFLTSSFATSQKAIKGTPWKNF
jgi:hypothetical protein